jgi:hypothetical protein
LEHFRLGINNLWRYVMLYDQLLEEVNEEGISEITRAERIQKVKEYIKAESHLYDDHGSAVIGSREGPPHYED